MIVGSAANIVKAQWTDDGRPQFHAADFKEMEARARGPDTLTEQEMGLVFDAKTRGNKCFQDGSHEAALRAYSEALDVFADRMGDAQQRTEKSKLLANASEALLRLERWQGALNFASVSLQADRTNDKARFRRARALTELGSLDQLQVVRPHMRCGTTLARACVAVLKRQPRPTPVHPASSGGAQRATDSRGRC